MQIQRRIVHLTAIIASTGFLTASLVVPSAGTPAPHKLKFQDDVMPILSDKCFKCHGPASNGRMAGLRLDDPASAFASRGGKYAIVPGHPEHSLVTQRITSKNDPMPPVYSGKTLSPAEITIINKWISEGAQYDKLWSFEPLPTRVAVPKVNSNWPKSDIDRFVLDRLQAEPLSPAPEAQKDRWLRRVTLDLTGLPPTQDEISAFSRDHSSQARAKVVDRLLASPHFGERIAVDWLDAARYSDSYGYQSDLISPTWPYRDWVVKAFNQNMPYSQFLTEQLAGDLLPAATRDQRLATAFNRLHRQSNEGGSIPLEFKTTYASDRVDTFGTAVLGLTVGCARCHDHKFDPITQREYYQFFAYFNSIDEFGLLLSSEIVPTPSMLLPTKDQEAKLLALKQKDAEAKEQLRKAIKEAKETRVLAWLASSPMEVLPDEVAHIQFQRGKDGQFPNLNGGTSHAESLGKLPVVPAPNGGAVVFDGDNGLAVRGLPSQERNDAFSWSFWIKDEKQSPNEEVLLHRTGGTDVGFCGFDLTIQDGYLTARVMRAPPGNSITIKTAHRISKGIWNHIVWNWDGSGDPDGEKLYIDGIHAQSNVLNGTLWKSIHAYGDLGDSRGDWTFAQRFRDAGFRSGMLSNITFFNRAISDLEVEHLYDGLAIGQALADPAHNTRLLQDYYCSAISKEVRDAQSKVREAQANLAKFEDGIFEVEVMQESKKPIPAYVLARGNYDAPRNDKTLVVRDTPKSLPPLRATGPNNRLALAKWVTSPNHPLTSRVAVNRLWQMMFGTGLVETSENFGVQGSRPTHPELLDYLARKFVDSGWNVKLMLREIALSATYGQDSAHTKSKNLVDPYNKLLARGPSRRLSAEMVRDTLLSAAGLLNDQVGGPPVNPYQPNGIWQENNAFSPPFVQSKGKDLYRRSIYSTWKRTTPIPSMLLFDATSREACMIRRPNTNTPLQALVLLNDVQFVEGARVLAEQVLTAKKSDREAVLDAFVRLAGRVPDREELQILLRTFSEQQTQFRSTPADAAKLIHMGDSKPAPRLNAVSVAAMTVTVQTILNSDAVTWKR